MTNKTITCGIKGITPLLMHAYPKVAFPGIEKEPPEVQAEFASYRDEVTKELYIPGICVRRCLIAAATYSKGKGRASLQKQTAACVEIFPERLSLGTTQYEIDAQSVVIQSTTKARIMRFRPRLNDWKIEFNIEFDSILLSEPQLKNIIDDAGTRVGLLDFRPACKGSFGRFMVIKWEC